MISGIPSQSVSSQSVTIKALNDVSDQSFSLSFSVLIPISSFSYPQSSFVLAKNSLFSVSPSITGDDLSFSITSGSLPTGLSLDSSSGIISGSPFQFVLSQSVTINAHNQVSGRFVILTFSILTPITSFSYSHSSIALPKNESFSFSPTVDGDDLSFSISSGSLPTGLSLNSTTGLISGIPSQSVLSQSVTIIAFNVVSDQSFSLSFTVLTPITSFSYPQFSFVLSKDESFSVIPTVDGDEVSFSISSGSLPMGLSLNPSNGMISGTLSTTIKSISLTVEACNGIGSIQTQLSFSVKALSSLSILLISLAILILIIVVVIGIIRKKSHMHLDRKRGSRKLPISYPTKLNHTPQTEKSSISVDNPPNMLSNIIVYDPPTPSHSS